MRAETGVQTPTWPPILYLVCHLFNSSFFPQSSHYRFPFGVFAVVVYDLPLERPEGPYDGIGVVRDQPAPLPFQKPFCGFPMDDGVEPDFRLVAICRVIITTTLLLLDFLAGHFSSPASLIHSRSWPRLKLPPSRTIISHMIRPRRYFVKVRLSPPAWFSIIISRNVSLKDLSFGRV